MRERGAQAGKCFLRPRRGGTRGVGAVPAGGGPSGLAERIRALLFGGGSKTVDAREAGSDAQNRRGPSAAWPARTSEVQAARGGTDAIQGGKGCRQGGVGDWLSTPAQVAPSPRRSLSLQPAR